MLPWKKSMVTKHNFESYRAHINTFNKKNSEHINVYQSSWAFTHTSSLQTTNEIGTGIIPFKKGKGMEAHRG